MNSNLALYEAEDDSILGLRRGWDIVSRNRRLIAAIALGVTLLGAVHAALKKPVYEGSMLIQVAPRTSGVKKNMLGDVAATFDQETTAAAEAGLVKSHVVLQPVAASVPGTTVEDLQRTLVVAEMGKDSGLISVSLRGADRVAIQAILGAIGKEYLRQHQQRRARAAQASQALLESQLPGLKRRMELAEETLNAFRDQHGTADLAEETRVQVRRLAASEQSLLEFAQKKSELLVRFAPAHPAVAGIDQQISLAVADKNARAARVRRLPLLEQELGRLAREVKLATDLYSNVLRTAQELRVISLDAAGGVRLADPPAIPNKPVNPRSTTIALSAAFGLLLGLMGAFANQLTARKYGHDQRNASSAS